ncbi:MAG: hypothetical protein PVJ57_09860 [Phycisphaerae bacterium]|jgi:hypothetical protein
MKWDLVVLVPDKNIEYAVRGLLNRAKSIGIRPITVAPILVHPGRDPGVYAAARDLLQPFVRDTDHALIVFDRAWDGAPSSDPTALAEHVERQCAPDWSDRVRCVCIDPEIEIWVWSNSPHVARVLDWSSNEELATWLRRRGLWPAGAAKPPDPKKAFQEALHEKQLVLSSAIFRELARQVGINRCQDPSFLRLLGILREWFPASGPRS